MLTQLHGQHLQRCFSDLCDIPPPPAETFLSTDLKAMVENWNLLKNKDRFMTDDWLICATLVWAQTGTSVENYENNLFRSVPRTKLISDLGCNNIAVSQPTCFFFLVCFFLTTEQADESSWCVSSSRVSHTSSIIEHSLGHIFNDGLKQWKSRNFRQSEALEKFMDLL